MNLSSFSQHIIFIQYMKLGYFYEKDQNPTSSPGPFVILGRRRKGLRLRPNMTKGPWEEVVTGFFEKKTVCSNDVTMTDN